VLVLLGATHHLDLAADLAAWVERSVHVRIPESGPDHRQDGAGIAGLDALRHGSQDVPRDHRAADGARCAGGQGGLMTRPDALAALIIFQ